MPITEEQREKNREKQRRFRKEHGDARSRAQGVAWALERRIRHRQYPIADEKKHAEQLHRDIEALNAGLRDALERDEIRLLGKLLRTPATRRKAKK
jgi:hypothetical protein